MNAAVLLIGDELLGGVVSDRNVAHAARALGPRGVTLSAVLVVGDDEEVIARAALRLAQECELLVVCGGLGPTDDDRTSAGLAHALSVPLVDARPAGTRRVANPVGTAPGFRGRLGSCEFWVVPGVPEEARVMLRELAATLPDPPPDHTWERIVATAGLRETAAADRIREAGFRPPPGVSLGYLPAPGGVVLRLAARAPVPEGDLAGAERTLRNVLGDDALPEPSLAASLVRVLAEAGSTVAAAESCTGGLIGARITDVPGASSVYLGGVVAYSNRAKTDLLGVPPSLLEEHGAVSEEVARAMAEGCRRRFGAQVAVSVTGIAGPSGGTPEKPVGTVCLGVDGVAGSEARTLRFSGTRELIRERSVNKALEMAYRRARAKPE